MAPNWQVNSLRFTLFPFGPLPAMLDVWRPLFGSPPEVEERREREGILRQTGPFHEGQLEITVAPGRLDIVMSPRPPDLAITAPTFGFHPPAPPQMIVADGKFAEWLQHLSPYIVAWAAAKQFQMQRIAIGGIALAPTPTVQASYELIGKQLKSVKVAPGKMKELVYRVNWQVASDKYVEFFNRVTGWSAVTFNLAAAMQGVIPIQSDHYVSLDFDINTPGERTDALIEADVTSIFNRLIALTHETLEAGECPSI